MAIVKKVEIDVSTVKAAGGLDAFKQQMKGVDKEVQNTSASTQQLSGSLDRMTGGAITKFSAFRGALNTVSQGFVTLRGAIIATGIGALIVLIGSLTAAFTRSEEGQNKLSKALGVLGSIVGNLLDVFSDFGETVIEAFENPKKAWDGFTQSLYNGWQFIKNQVIDRFQGGWDVLSGQVQAGILKMRIAWNEFTGDSTEANQLKKELEEINQQIIEGNEKIKSANNAVINVYDNAINKVKEFGKEIVKDSKNAAKIADQRAAAEKAARDLIIDRANAERDIAELREKAADKENVSTEERIKALEEAGRISEELAQKEIAVSKLRADAKTLENSLSKSTREDLDEEARLRADVINAETAKLKLQKALTAELTTARRESAAAAKGETKATKEQVDEIGKILEDFRKKEQDRAAETEVQKIELEQQRALAELERLVATEEQKQKVKDYYEIELTRARAEEETKLKQETADAQKAIDEAEKEFKENQYRTTYDNLQNILSVGGKKLQKVSKALAIADVVRTASKSVSETVSSIGSANAKAVAASPLTGGMPFVAINTIKGALQIGSTLASSAKALQAIKGDSKSVSGSSVASATGGGGGSAPTVPTAPQPPAFNVVGQGGTNQLAQVIREQTQQPVQAYVVANDVTSAQSLQRNIQSEAGIGG
jgi:hypothetical protein